MLTVFLGLFFFSLKTERKLLRKNTTESWSFLPKICFLDILVVFRLDLGQISFNLVQKAFATWQLALLATIIRIVFFDIWAWACAEIKILDEKVAYTFRLFEFQFFFLLSFSFWLTFYWACLQLKSFKESITEFGNFYHGTARCSSRKFCCEFFIQRFEHFCAYLRLH